MKAFVDQTCIKFKYTNEGFLLRNRCRCVLPAMGWTWLSLKSFKLVQVP